MPTKRPQFINGEIYHVIVRGIGGRKTFLEERDYLRYLLSLYKFNDKDPVLDRFYRREATPAIMTKAPKLEKPRDVLVEILSLSLMPNHIHLLLRQLQDNGIPLFIQKLGGYSTYFNKYHKRFGSLFQRPFKAIHIEDDDQLFIVTTYIHMNAIDLVEYDYKEKGISNPEKVIEFLKSHPWSSYPHYLGAENISWLIDKDFLNKVFGGPDGFKEFVEARVYNKAKLKDFLKESRVFLE